MTHKLTKIVATISDLNCSPEFIRELHESGVNVVRLNTAHQTHEDTMKVVNAVREVSEEIALLVDTKGPEVRTSKTDGEILLKKGSIVKVDGKKELISDAQIIHVSYAGIVKDVPVGASLLIDDGEVELKVTEVNAEALICEVMNDGYYKSNKSVNVPGVHLELASLTEKDKGYVKFSIENNIDFIAHSFVRNKEDVLEIQDILDEHNSDIKIIAKIENRQGVDNIDEILEYAHGVMVARGDLGIEIPIEEVPEIQKELIMKCRLKHKPVITATQMLHTMIKNPRPTRAEVSDVANAVYDGTDAVMLSGETAYGDYPIEAVKMMAKIARQVEARKSPCTDIVIKNDNKQRVFLSKSAINAAHELDVDAIVIHTVSGETARVVSAYRPSTLVFSKSSDKRVVRELSMSYGVYAHYTENVDSTDDLVKHVLSELVKEEKLAKDADVVLLGAANGAESENLLEVCNVSSYLN